MSIAIETRIFAKVLDLLIHRKDDDVIIYWDDTNQMVFTLKGHEAEVTVNFENHSHFHLGYRPREKDDYERFIDVLEDVTDDELKVHVDEAINYIRTVNA